MEFSTELDASAERAACQCVGSWRPRHPSSALRRSVSGVRRPAVLLPTRSRNGERLRASASGLAAEREREGQSLGAAEKDVVM